MGFKLDRVHVWSGEVVDRAGGVAAKLAALAQANANLEFILTRRQPDRPGTGMLYVAPVTGPIQVRAARAAGLAETGDPIVLHVEGDNEAGLAHRLTQNLGTCRDQHGRIHHGRAGQQIRRLCGVRFRRRREPGRPDPCRHRQRRCDH